MVLRGWRNYFRLDERKGIFESLDIHIRRHLRKLIWIAWKKPKTRARNLIQRGLDPQRAWKSSMNGRGAWWNAGALHMRQAFDNQFCLRRLSPPLMFENRRMPNGTSEPSLGLCGVGGRACEGSLYPIWRGLRFSPDMRKAARHRNKVGRAAFDFRKSRKLN